MEDLWCWSQGCKQVPAFKSAIHVQSRNALIDKTK